MKKVIRYQCEFCKKEFKTPDRHKCKRDPAKKNCYTCQNNKGWNVDEHSDEWGGYKWIYPTCEFNDDVDAKQLCQIDYNLQCNHYKQLESGYSVMPREFYEATEEDFIF